MIYYVERLYPARHPNKNQARTDARERCATGRAGWTVEIANVEGAWEVSYVRSL